VSWRTDNPVCPAETKDRRARIVVAIVANMEGDRFGSDARAIAKAFEKH
jgi:hypothetical protein